MQAIPMVRANALIPFTEFLESIGAPLDRLLESRRLSPLVVAEPERLLPLHQCLAFLEHAARSQGLPDLGLLVGLRSRFAVLGNFAQLIRGAPTLQAALSRLIDAIALHNSGDMLWLNTSGERARLCHRFRLGDVPGRGQGELFAVAMMIAAMRAMLEGHWQPDEIQLTSRAVGLHKLYREHLGRPLVCSGEVTWVAFPSALLATPCHSSSGGDAAFHAADSALRASAPADDFAASIRQTVGALLTNGYPSVQQTAESVGLSPRTLQRRLAEHGERYVSLVEAVRLELAARLLRDSDARIVEIASELGYTDPANFTRAFRRWTGVAPRVYRRTRA